MPPIGFEVGTNISLSEYLRCPTISQGRKRPLPLCIINIANYHTSTMDPSIVDIIPKLTTHVITDNFSPIKVVSGDVAGVVRDGPDTLVDIDYQLDLSTVTVTFSGYESERDGVTRYEWAVGSAPRLDDVMPYSYVNLVTDDGGASGMLGKTTLKGSKPKCDTKLIMDKMHKIT